MRIAQVSPLFESVPPKLYGGTERVVSYLTEELVAAGHEVTLFASADSVTSAKLVPVCDRALRLDHRCQDEIAHHIRMIDQVHRVAYRFDFIHFHVDYLHFPLSSRKRVAHLTTLHGRLDIADLVPLYRAFPQEPVVSISDNQRQPLEWINWQGTVYHGLPPHLLKFRATPGKYLAFLGRFSPEKRPDRAIDLARRTGMPLRMAAKIDNKDREYFESKIKPLMKTAPVEYVGEINEREKNDFLGQAAALVFPVDWPEPFGLVMIESMACGTPVIAWRRGSVPEVIDHGASGFIVSDMAHAQEVVGEIPRLDRRRVRQSFDTRFTAARMAREYVQVYRRVIWGTHTRHRAAS